MHNQNIFTILHLLVTVSKNIANVILSNDRAISKFQHAKNPESFTRNSILG